VDTTTFVDAEKAIKKLDPKLVVTNESRFLGLHLAPGQSLDSLAKSLARLSQLKGVEMTALRRDRSVELHTAAADLSFAYGPAICAGESYSLAVQGRGLEQAAAEFRCPEQLDSANPKYPFLVSELTRFLQAPNHPDALVIAKPQVSFTKGSRGSHGGPTADEVIVPVLLRNASFHGAEMQPTSELLKILDQT
jgi:hypothetical protein